MSLLANEVFCANIGIPETFYSVEFFANGVFETLETNPFPTPRRLRHGTFLVKEDGKTLELRYDRAEEEEEDEHVLRAEFCVVEQTTNHVLDQSKTLTTHKTLVCNQTLLPYNAADIAPPFRFFRCPLVWYALPKE